MALINYRGVFPALNNSTRITITLPDINPEEGAKWPVLWLLGEEGMSSDYYVRKCDVESLTDVSCESFIPKPKVDSVVIGLTPKESDLTSDDFKIYSKFTKALFQHRNKKIRNALIDSRHVVSNLDKKEIKKRLNNIDDERLNEYLTKRVVVLTPEEILFISKEINPIFND